MIEYEGISTDEGIDIADLQDKASGLPISALMYAGGDDPSEGDPVLHLYTSFMNELAHLGVSDFDSSFLPFDPDDGSIDTFDTDIVTIADLMRLIDHSQKIEDPHDIPYGEPCCSRDVLEALANLLCMMAERAVGGGWNTSAFPEEQLSCCRLLLLPVDTFKEIYRENLSANIDDQSQVVLRMHDFDKMLTWTFEDDRDTQLIISGMPTVSLLGELTRYAWYIRCGEPCPKNPQYIYEFLYGIIFNLFGVYRDI